MRSGTVPGARLALAAVLAVVVAWSAAAPAGAAPKDRRPPIDPYAPYQPQTVCDPTPKPGVVAFAKLLLEAYPVSGWSGISRDCGVRGRSEHKEGRAFDWAVSVSNPEQRAAAEDAIAKLLAPDADGNPNALFRRFGLMYIIFNHRIFSAAQHDAGWRPYACSSSASFDDCHVNHVHFSFSIDGAMQRTSWWEMAPEPSRTASSIERIDEPGRADTAIAITSRTFPTRGSAEHVYVADAGEPHDAIIASVMAGGSHGAVLLTRGGDALEATVDTELRRLLGDHAEHDVTFVGDTEVLPDDLLAAYRGRYRVRRITGADEFATARAAALDMENTGQQRTAVVAATDALDEALPMVAVAAANDWPVLFTDHDELSSDTRGFLDEAGVRQVHLAGSSGAIPTKVRRQIAAIDGVTVERHGASNAYRTSVAVAEHFFAIPSAYALVNADDTVTAAVAAAYAGERRHAPLLLTDGETVRDVVADYILQTTAPGNAGILVGDRTTLRPEVERRVRRALR